MGYSRSVEQNGCAQAINAVQLYYDSVGVFCKELSEDGRAIKSGLVYGVCDSPQGTADVCIVFIVNRK